MNGSKEGAAALPVADHDLEHAGAVTGRHLGEAAVGKSRRLGVGGMHLDERLGRMRAEPRGEPRPRHGVPLVAHAPGVEPERKVLARRRPGRRRLGRDEAGLAVGRIEAAVGEEAPVLLLRRSRLALAQRPLHGIERVEGAVADRGEAADVEVAPAAVLERRQGGVLAKDVGGARVGKRIGETHAAGDLAHDPPVGPRVARRRQERPLARESAARNW